MLLSELPDGSHVSFTQISALYAQGGHAGDLRTIVGLSPAENVQTPER
jgi:hypothetical protein